MGVFEVVKEYRKVFLLSLLSCAVIWATIALIIKGDIFSSKPFPSGNFPLTEAWKFETRDAVASSLVSKDNYVFVRTRHTIYELETATGKELWQANTDSGLPLIIAPQITGNYVVVPENISGLASFNSLTGELIWRILPLDISRTNTVTGSIESLAINDTTIFVARYDWTLAAYEINSGNLLWEDKIVGRAFPYIVCDNQKLFLAHGSQLTEVNPKNGVIISQIDIGGFLGPVVLSNKILMVSDEENNIIYSYDIDGINNNAKWSRKLPINLDIFELKNLAIYNKYLLVSANRLIALSTEDGRLMWESRDTKRLESPAIMNDIIYIRNTENDLYAFDLTSGIEKGQLSVLSNTTMKHEPFRSPISVNDLLIVPYGDTRIFAFRP